MGSSSGGTFSSKRSPADLLSAVRNEEAVNQSAQFKAELAGVLSELLATCNNRDVPLVRERLSNLKELLAGALEGSFDQLFGGSVAKHTYVDGLSDIDSVVVIGGSELDDASPADALRRMAGVLQEKLGANAKVSHGRMAVSVEYGDGMVVQLLPAHRDSAGKLRVPSSRHEGWSSINPDAFREALTRRNEECGGRLVPVIKLAKAINGQLPESQRLSGYHMESLGIAAFKGYDGERTVSAMLPHYFEKAKNLIASPIQDSTGQSVHVDEYLGEANSPARMALGHVLGRIGRRMQNASASGSVDQWKALFGEGI